GLVDDLATVPAADRTRCDLAAAELTRSRLIRRAPALRCEILSAPLRRSGGGDQQQAARVAYGRVRVVAGVAFGALQPARAIANGRPAPLSAEAPLNIETEV